MSEEKVKKPAFQFYVLDMLGDQDLKLLSNEEFGILLKLKAYYWNGKCSLRNDMKDLSRLVGCAQSKFERVWARLSSGAEEMFKVVDGVIKHPKLDEYWLKSDEFHEKMSAAGKAGAAARYGKQNANQSDPSQSRAIPKPKPSHTQAKAEPYPSQSRAIPKPKHGMLSSSSSSLTSPSSLNKSAATAAGPFEKNGNKFDLRQFAITGLDDPAKHKCFNLVLKVLEARGWVGDGTIALSVFRAVVDRVNAAKPTDAYPYFQASLGNYMNENAELLSAQARTKTKRIEDGGLAVESLIHSVGGK